MKLKDPQIAFDVPGPYYPGQIVSGRARWTLESDVKVKSLYLFFRGKCKVKWTKGSGDDEKTYKAKEKYLGHTIWLHGDGRGEVSLSAGVYFSPFTYTLPADIPPSFTGKYGSVTYSVSLSIETTGFFGTAKGYEVPFTVERPMANAEQRPLRLSAEADEYGCCCPTKANFGFELNIGQSTFCPGQQVYVAGHVLNESGLELSEAVFSLIMHQTFYGIRTSRPKPKEKAIVLATWSHNNSSSISRYNFVNQPTLTIPIMPYYDMAHCGIIDITYLLQFSLPLPGLCSDVLISTAEIVVTNDVTRTQEPTGPAEIIITESVRNGTFQPASPLSIYHDSSKSTEPPSYTEALQMGDMPYNPLRPPNMSTGATNETSYYDWNQSAFTRT